MKALLVAKFKLQISFTQKIVMLFGIQAYKSKEDVSCMCIKTG